MSSLVITAATIRGASFKVPGYKHASNILLAASVAVDSDIVIKNAPDITDTRALLDILDLLGAYSQFEAGSLMINCSLLKRWDIPEHTSELCHGSIYLLPVLLGKLGKARIGRTGGCQIGDKSSGGSRPVVHMIEVLKRFGASFAQNPDSIEATSGPFVAAEIDIFEFSDLSTLLTGPLISGATKTAILASLFVKEGATTIFNPYRKPDVTELLEFARIAGYEVKDTPNKIVISTTDKARAVCFELLEDISVIMTYITIAVFNNLCIRIEVKQQSKVKEGLKAELELLDKMNIHLLWNDNFLVVSGPYEIKAIFIEVTSVGIYSDHQPFFALMLTKADGTSKISEFVWKNRFDYAIELNKLSDQELYRIEGNELLISPGRLSRPDQKLCAGDLRAAAVLLIAALQVPGVTVIEGIDHLARGYEDLVADVRNLYANIQVV